MMDLTKEMKQLEEAREMRARSIVKIHLDACVDRVMDMGERLRGIVDGSKSLKAAFKPLRDIISDEVERAADGMLTVVEYAQKALSKQDVLVYVGTHWMTIRTQVFYDFIRACALKMGLPGEFLYDPEYMNRLFEQVAFRVSRDREQEIPRGQVWVNLQNGTLEISSKGGIALREHRRDDFFKYVLPYSYDPAAVCPRWHRFLDRVVPEQDAQMLIAEYIGYCFTRDLKQEKVLVLYGSGANGKSVTTDVITGLLGEQNVSHVDLEKLTTDENQRAMTEDKLANISTENGPNVNYHNLKMYASGEPLSVKNLYRDSRLMYRFGKLIACFNILPQPEKTEGFFRRWMLVPFNVTITREERDIHLKDKLLQELPGILNWALEGLQRIIANDHFTESATCERALEDYKVDMNSALRFVTDCCVEDVDGRLTLKDLFNTYRSYCMDENIKKFYGKNNFAKQLRDAGYKTHNHANIAYYELKFKSTLE